MEKKVKTFNSKIKYTTDFRNVKYPRLEFKTGELKLILPKEYKNEKELLEKHVEWIKNKHEEIKWALKVSKNKEIENREVNELKKLITKYCKGKINKIFLRKMRSKWASLSSNNNLTINKLLRFLPEELIKYVVYHELVHQKERKHNRKFWRFVERKFKDYQDKEKELFVYWFTIQDKLRK